MAIHEIRVFPKDEDSEAEALRQQTRSTFGYDLDVSTARVFYVEDVTDPEAERLATELFTDPLTQSVRLATRQHWQDSHTVEAAYKPGVMNPERESLEAAAGFLGIKPKAVDSAIEYHFAKSIPPEIVSKVVKGLLINETVQHVRRHRPETLAITGKEGPVETIPIRDLGEKGLQSVAEKNNTFLDAAEQKIMQEYFRLIGRDPTDAELHAIAARWSEHCGHKTFNAKLFVNGQEKAPLFTRIKETAHQYFDEDLLSAFEDNAGVFRFYDGQAINLKLETHNSPSAIEPYGGAMTGSGGVFRDILGTGKGARNILSVDIRCLGPLNLPQDQIPPNCFHPIYMQRRTTDGIRDYGNRMGIPTADVELYYHPDFRGKPVIMVGAAGILPEKYSQKGHPEYGDLVVAIGGRTGRDGIHGATFSSGSMTAETATLHSGAVQIGNAIEEKRMSDAILEARDADCIRALTDCGAAGFSSAIGEMGEGIGVRVDINRAPLKYQGLAPWEIWLSESQERMVAAIIPEKYEEFAAICRKHGVEIAALGTFGTPEAKPTLNVTYDSQQLIDLDYDFLENGLAQREMAANWQAPAISESLVAINDWSSLLKNVLAHSNIRSIESTVRQYDHEVQAKMVVKPFTGVHQDMPNRAVVIRPLMDKPYGVVEAHGLNPVLNNIDPYKGSLWAIAEAMSKYVAVGGDPDKAYLSNNFVTATPDEQVMGALDKMVDAIEDGMHALKRPVFTGKDSLSARYIEKDENGNVTDVIDVPPVLTITAIGKIPDVAKTVTADLKKLGSTLVLVGKPDYTGMGGSVFYDIAGATSTRVPKVDIEQLPRTLRSMHKAIQSGEVLACRALGRGGLFTAVSEMAFGGDCGAQLSFDTNADADRQLLNETAGCFVVEVVHSAEADKLFAGTPYQIIGQSVPQKTIKANRDGQELFHEELYELKAAWKPGQEAV